FPDPGNNTQPNLGSMTIGAISPGLGGVMDNLYSTPYKLIASANYFLDNVDKASLPEETVNVYKAEVRFLRALAYFDLVQSRSEEHTSELQSRENIVCRLLLEKKNTSDRLVV